MKIVNRGYLTVTPTKLFIDWANKNDEEFSDLISSEASIYLIEDDFYDDEPVLKSNFKNVFLNELQAVTEDESTYPEIKFEVFNDWFTVALGASVFDAESNGLSAS